MHSGSVRCVAAPDEATPLFSQVVIAPLILKLNSSGYDSQNRMGRQSSQCVQTTNPGIRFAPFIYVSSALSK
jgi:hypothetical protein